MPFWQPRMPRMPLYAPRLYCWMKASVFFISSSLAAWAVTANFRKTNYDLRGSFHQTSTARLKQQRHPSSSASYFQASKPVELVKDSLTSIRYVGRSQQAQDAQGEVCGDHQSDLGIWHVLFFGARQARRLGSSYEEKRSYAGMQEQPARLLH